MALFLSDRVRPDAVAMLALGACVLGGLVKPDDAFEGFASSAVVTVAAVLIIGRAFEVTGAAGLLLRATVPDSRVFIVQFAALLLVAAGLSAFMNNIAALAIVMPAGLAIAQRHKVSPSVVLMPLAFAAILGGMTTLIGTPANLILSSVLEDTLGQPFGLFSMTPVAGPVALAGVAYLAFVGWRLTPRRIAAGPSGRRPARVFELVVGLGSAHDSAPIGEVRARLREAGGVLLARLRGGERISCAPRDRLEAGDRLLVISRHDPWTLAAETGLSPLRRRDARPGATTTWVTVAHGSVLEGMPHGDVEARSGGALAVVAAGPRAARLRQPMASLLIQPGDQLWLHGPAAAVDTLARQARLIEVEREPSPPVSRRPAFVAVMIFILSILAISLGVPAAAGFAAAALAIALLRLIPGEDIYRAIDWQVVVLLAAMIPIGRAFQDSGASQIAAGWLAELLSYGSAALALGGLCFASMLFSAFMNNVTTAVVMGQVGAQAANALGLPVEAALIAVLIGTSCDFLTPIGHQNNLVVMRPGGYRFSDYPRMGAPLTLLVIITTALMLDLIYL